MKKHYLGVDTKNPGLFFYWLKNAIHLKNVFESEETELEEINTKELKH